MKLQDTYAQTVFVLVLMALEEALKEKVVPHPGGPPRLISSLVLGCLKMAGRYCVCFLRL